MKDIAGDSFDVASPNIQDWEYGDRKLDRICVISDSFENGRAV